MVVSVMSVSEWKLALMSVSKCEGLWFSVVEC